MGNISVKQKYDEIRRNVLQHVRRYFIRNILQDTIHFLNILLPLTAGFIIINLLFEVHSVVRELYAAGILIWFLVYTYRKILPSFMQLLKPSESQLIHIAKLMGHANPDVQDALVNYIQISGDKSDSGSEILKKLAINQLLSRIADRNFRNTVRFKDTIRGSGYAALLIGVFCISYLFFPGQMGLAAAKIFVPWKSFQEPIPVALFNRSGNIQLLRNNNATLVGEFSGIKPDRLFLVIKRISGDSLHNKEQIETEKIALSVPVSNHFQYRLDHVRESFTYYFQAGIGLPRFRNRLAQSEEGRVMVKERPRIRNVQVKIVPPTYTGEETRLLPPNNGEITALKGSRASVTIEADKQISRAYIQFSDSAKLPLDVRGHTAGGEFSVLKSLNYHIKIFDADSIDNSEPIEYGIFPLQDELPYAEIKQPGADVDLGDNLNLPLFIEMRDDYGFRGLWVKGVLIRQGSTGDSSQFELKLPYKKLDRGKAFSETNWELTPFYMIPDDYIQYYAEVVDNDAVSGPKSYKTGIFTIRLPSLLDMFTENEKSQEDQLSKVEKTAKETGELKKKLEQINREMKRGQEVNWERKQEIKDQLEKQKESLNELKEVQKKLEDVISDLDEKKMISAETLQKYMELKNMLEELSSPELKEAMKKLEEALQKSNQEEIQKALEKFKFSVDEFEKSIERTYELFKQVQLEQKMDELAKLAEKINEDQGKINEKMSKKGLSQKELDQLKAAQGNTKKNMEFLEQKTQNTSQSYQALMKEKSKMLEQAMDFMTSEKMPQSMSQMQDMLDSGQQNSALQKGQQMKPRLDMLQNMMQMARQQMLQSQKQELADAMQKTMQDLLSVSYKQEDLSKQSRKLNSASSQINDVAKKQDELRQATRQVIGQLVDIGNKTFFLSPQLNQTLSKTMNSMDNAIQQLEDRNPRQAATSQQNAMESFNQALMSMQNSMNQMGQSSSATGFQEYLQQLQQMAGQQGQINQQSMGMLQQSQQGRLQLSADDMARLAAQQEMVRQSLQKLSDQMGNRRDVLGRLGDMGQEMKEIVKKLKEQQLDRKVIERQEKILSRLLDAQKSVREKEYSKKREAEWEKQKIVQSPPALREDMLRKEDRLRKELMQSMQEGYSNEYRELIKLYFEALARHPGQDKN